MRIADPTRTRWWSRIVRDESVRSALFNFTLTRVLVIAIIIVGGQMFRVITAGSEPAYDLYLTLEKIPVARILHQTAETADANWYEAIAQRGYERIPYAGDKPHNWAFFPLFPMLWRMAAYLTGEFPLTGMVLSHIFFLAALFFVHRSALAFGFTTAIADRSVAYLAIFPTSYFYSMPLTESLFLLLTAACIYLAKRGRWWTAGVIGALASATRAPGILVLPALMIIYWQAFGGDWRDKKAWAAALWRKELASLLIVPLGIVSYMIFLHAITGNAFAFKDILGAWGRSSGFFLITLVRYFTNPLLIAASWDFRVLNAAGACLALAGGVMLLKWRQWALGVYTLLAVIATLSSLVLQSQARYAMVLFPAFIALAVLGERRRANEVIRAVSIGLLCLMTALFAAHVSTVLS